MILISKIFVYSEVNVHSIIDYLYSTYGLNDTMDKTWQFARHVPTFFCTDVNHGANVANLHWNMKENKKPQSLLIFNRRGN